MPQGGIFTSSLTLVEEIPLSVPLEPFKRSGKGILGGKCINCLKDFLFALHEIVVQECKLDRCAKSQRVRGGLEGDGGFGCGGHCKFSFVVLQNIQLLADG